MSKVKVDVESFIGVMQSCTCNMCDWTENLSTHSDPPLASRLHVQANPTHTVTRVFGNEFVYTAQDN